MNKYLLFLWKSPTSLQKLIVILKSAHLRTQKINCEFFGFLKINMMTSKLSDWLKRIFTKFYEFIHAVQKKNYFETWSLFKFHYSFMWFDRKQQYSNRMMYYITCDWGINKFLFSISILKKFLLHVNNNEIRLVFEVNNTCQSGSVKQDVCLISICFCLY